MTPKKPEPDESTSSSAEGATERRAAAAPVTELPPHPSAPLVEEWFAKHFHNMPALFDERAYTHLLGAKEDLKVLLAQSL